MLEVIEHLDDWKKIISKLKKFIKPNGILVISTINRNFLSRFFALFIAEYILNWVPKQTHDYNKLIKPIELISFLKKNKFKKIDLSGLTYNPILKEWSLNKKNFQINYFCSFIKSN